MPMIGEDVFLTLSNLDHGKKTARLAIFFPFFLLINKQIRIGRARRENDGRSGLGEVFTPRTSVSHLIATRSLIN